MISLTNKKNVLFSFLLVSAIFTCIVGCYKIENIPNYVDKISMSARIHLFNESNDGVAINKIFSIIGSYDTGLSDLTEKALAEFIYFESKKYDYDPFFITALIQTESHFNRRAKSKYGAIGLMQILPYVGKSIAQEHNVKWSGEDTLYNPFTNIKIGLYFLNKLADKFNNNKMLYLSAYNLGPSRMSYRIKNGRSYPKHYALKVLNTYNEIIQ